MKHNRLISLVEEMPKHNIESAIWLLLIFLLQIYSENKHVGQKKYTQNVQFREEKIQT